MSAAEQLDVWRSASLVTFGRVTQPLWWWAELYGLTARDVLRRLRLDWTIEDAITAPSWAHHPSDGTPYELDVPARKFVAAHPDGATLEQVGEFFGVSRERVRQIEAVAALKLQGALGSEGLRLLEHVMQKRGEDV